MSLTPSIDSSNRLLATLYAAPMQPELWKVFMAQTAQLCEVNKAALLVHDLRNKHHSISAFFGDSVREGGPLYESYYCQFDEWTLRFPHLVGSKGQGRVLNGEEIWPEKLLQRSVFYNEFLKRFDICQMATLAAGSSGERLEALSIYRGPHETPLDREQLAVLQMIAPHLQTALGTRRRLLALESRVSDLENAFDQLETALMLVNAQGSPVFVNRQARRIFDQRDGLHLCRSRLIAENPGENGRLREIIAKAISGGRSRSREHGGATLVSRASRRPLQILAFPFIPGDLWAAKGAVAVIFISDPDLKPALRSDVLRELYGLTEAEARLALLLSDGQSLTEAAASIRVGRETVRSQIKSIFLKTETRRQSELIGLLARLPGRNI